MAKKNNPKNKYIKNFNISDLNNNSMNIQDILNQDRIKMNTVNRNLNNLIDVQNQLETTKVSINSSDINNVKNFYKNYISSNNYKNRLSKFNKNPNSIINSRLKNVDDINFINKEDYTYYTPNFNSINKGNNLNDYILAHEYSHGLGANLPSPIDGLYRDNGNSNYTTLSPEEVNEINSRSVLAQNEYDRFTNKNTFGRAVADHDSSPEEIKADIDAYRYMLFNDGIYDTSKEDFNKSILEKSKSKYKSNPIFKRLNNTVSEEDLIWIMNNIANVSNSNNNIQYAQNGGYVLNNNLMAVNKKNKKTPRDKYALGSFVEGSRQISSQYQNQIDSLVKPKGGNAGSQALSLGATGASIGTSIMPGIGTAIGAIGGALGGLILGDSADRREAREYNRQVTELESARSNLNRDLYESSLNLNNTNPYGVYAKGGDVVNNQINIEKGEIQINPEDGKIIREYNGINPETGGMYEKHAKGNKKDTENNMVTAEEGTFIITKKEAAKYKEAVDNNDKLYQNSIMSNIRNMKSKTTKKYATGGLVDPNLLYSMPMAGVNPSGNINMPSNISVPARQNLSANVGGNNQFNLSGLGNIASTALNYLPSAYNMIQGSRRANTMPYTPIRMNIDARQRIMSNLPQEMSANPALNNIRRARGRSYRSINNNTSNPTIARANRLSLEGNFLGAENEALYNNQLMNNQIRSQRAGILSNLSAQDQNRDAQNVQLLNNNFIQNRQMQLAKKQQFDYGLTQAQQMYQNNITNKQKRDMERRQLEIMNQIFPALSYYPEITAQGGRI